MHANRSKHAPRPHAGTPAPVRAAQPAADAGDSRAARCASADAIRLSAYRKWELAGKPPGDGVQFWLEAERDLLNGK